MCIRVPPFVWCSLVLLLVCDSSIGASESEYRRLVSSVSEPAVRRAVIVSNSTCGICGNSYLAGIGETLQSIAAYCNIRLDEAAKANPDLDPSGANLTGTVLHIPCTDEDNAHCGICGDAYTVKEGNTLSSIAEACGMDLAVLENANQDIDVDNIDVGQFVRVPCQEETATIAITGCGACGTKYTAESDGELLVKVAQRCNASIQELLQANPGRNISNNSTLLRGQQLNVPCGNNTRNCGLCGDRYIVSDDDQQSVASKCRVGLIELTRSNPSVSWDNLEPGQALNIPCKPSKGQCLGHLCDSKFEVTRNSSVTEVATSCNVTSALISYANNIPVTGTVHSGQSLAIPCEASPNQVRSCSICGSSIAPTSVVDLLLVAKVCSTTVKEIQQATNISLMKVTAGDILDIPCNQQSAGCGPCGIAYKAQVRDTVASIAVKCATMIPDLTTANPNLNFSGPLSGGELITVPCASSETSAGAFSMRAPISTILFTILVVLL